MGWSMQEALFCDFDWDFENFQKLWGEWADETFPQSTLNTIVSHFREESIEFAGGWKEQSTGTPFNFILATHDPIEAADCLLLLLHHAHKAGYDLFDEALKKAKINVQRDWDTTDEAEAGYFKHK